MSKNGYLQRQKQRDRVRQDAATETERQYLVDMLCIVLNDPEVMGKDTFGKARLHRVVAAMMKEYDVWHGALELNNNTDYLRGKLDQRLQKVFGPELAVFEKRYEWLRDTRPPQR